MLRILHVLDKISVDSGASNVVMNYYEKLDHGKLTFDFMLNEEPDADTRAKIENNGSKIFIMPALKFANTLKYIKALKTFYKEHKYKIIHGHVANSAVFYLGYARSQAARNSTPKRIIHSHNTKSSDIFLKRIRNWVLTRFICCVADKYMACSKAAADFLFGKRKNAKILGNAIDIDRFAFNAQIRESIRGKLSIGDRRVIGHIGRFSAQKNHKFLIDVFCKLLKSNKNTVLLLIGSGELYSTIKQKVKNCGVEDSVIFTGVVDNTNEYLSAMDVFVLPSLFEGLPMTGVEAQINNLPCVFSDTITKEAKITVNTQFVPINEAGIWVDEINRLLKIGRIENKDTQTERFDINIQVKKLISYYEELL